jgi:hypothetical protein
MEPDMRVTRMATRKATRQAPKKRKQNEHAELIFVVEDAPEGGYTARALSEAIFTEADGLKELRSQIRDAVQCHFEGRVGLPKVIRLHFVREEVLAV